jgi:RNA polymerase sigma-70 factor (ECF subfamily)
MGKYCILEYMTDQQLVREFLEGNDDAMGKLVEKYLKPIYNFTYQLTRDTGASQDITQDVFVRMWQNLESFDENRKFSTWLYAIAKNASLDWLKKKKAMPFAFFERIDGSNMLENIEDSASFSSAEILKLIDARNDTAEFLALLPIQAQTILILHHLQGFPLVEIAEIMGQSPNTVKSQYRRAILLLRKNIFEDKITSAPKTSIAA